MAVELSTASSLCQWRSEPILTVYSAPTETKPAQEGSQEYCMVETTYTTITEDTGIATNMHHKQNVADTATATKNARVKQTNMYGENVTCGCLNTLQIQQKHFCPHVETERKPTHLSNTMCFTNDAMQLTTDNSTT